MGWGIPHLLRGMETFFPRGGNPFSMKAWGPIFRGMRSPFPTDGSLFFEGSDALSDGWEPFYRGMGILFPRGAKAFSEGVGTAFPKDACRTTTSRKMGPNSAQICPLTSRMHIFKASLDAGLKKTKKHLRHLRHLRRLARFTYVTYK